jgi:phosphoribosylanthranilate isomerase
MVSQPLIPQVKVCGVTSVADALMVVDAGVNLLGLNFVASSPRVISVAVARAIVEAVGSQVEVVGVVANWSSAELNELRQTIGLHAWQLHGDEPPEAFVLLSEVDYKAVRIAHAADVELARAYPGRRILVDAKVQGVLGGSGHSFDWRLVQELAQERQLLLAGGITPDNVVSAIESVRPWAIDTASGVEFAPGQKDPLKVRALVARAQGGASF